MITKKMSDKKKRNIYWIVGGVVAVILAIIMIVTGNRPEFFDIFGLAVFTYLFLVGVWMFKKGKKIPNWIRFPLVIIGILGLIVDGYIVTKTFILGG